MFELHNLFTIINLCNYKNKLKNTSKKKGVIKKHQKTLEKKQ